MRARSALVLVAVGMLGLTACGLEDPYEREPATEKQKPAHANAGAGSAATAESPEQALERLALAEGNWTTSTVERAYERARELSAGSAWEQLSREGAAVIASVMRTPERLRSRTTVEAVVVRGSGARRNAIVVTRGGVLGGGLADEVYEYKVTLATVELQGQRWVISRWSPQP